MSKVDYLPITCLFNVLKLVGHPFDDVVGVARFLAPGADTYSAKDVIERLLDGVNPS